MSQLMKVVFLVIGAEVGLAILHIWQNVGFENVGLGGSAEAVAQARFRVGFLPVT